MEMFGKEVLEPVMAMLRAHAGIAPLILFGIMLLEGIILTTFLFSGALMTLAAGALIKAGVLDYWHVFIAIFTGFWMGDTINFALAHRGEHWFRNLGVVKSRQALLERAEALIARWGTAAIFVSRFMGPSRPFVTFFAGVLRMPAFGFHVATVLATLLLTWGLLNAGITGVELWERFKAK
jgi:membrane protein DedA with SNARE-associated domain